MVHLKCEMSVFINETDSAEDLMKTDLPYILNGWRRLVLLRTSMIQSRDMHWLQNLQFKENADLGPEIKKRKNIKKLLLKKKSNKGCNSKPI